MIKQTLAIDPNNASALGWFGYINLVFDIDLRPSPGAGP